MYLRRINGEFYRFDVDGMYENMQYTVYESINQGFYNWHTDIGVYSSDSVTRKLSMSLLLTDPSTYEGGDLEICDDHELLVRTYLKTKFYKIEKPIYIYRITGDNTSIDHRNAEIQIKTREIFNRYAVELAEKDAKENGLLLVDLS